MLITTKLDSCSEETFYEYLRSPIYSAFILNSFGMYDILVARLEEAPDQSGELEQIRKEIWAVVFKLRERNDEWIKYYSVINIAMCTRCGVEALGARQIEEIFGYNRKARKMYPQSYCYQCRRKERREAYSREEKNDQRAEFIDKTFSSMGHLFTKN